MGANAAAEATLEGGEQLLMNICPHGLLRGGGGSGPHRSREGGALQRFQLAGTRSGAQEGNRPIWLLLQSCGSQRAC